MTMLALDFRRMRIRRLVVGLATGIFILWSAPVYAALAPDSFSELAKKVSPAVVGVVTTLTLNAGNEAPSAPFAFPEGSPFEKFFREFRNREGRDGQPRVAHALGSGFVIDPSGYVVTNNHVVNEATSVKVRLADGAEYDARVVGTDELTDLALLKIETDKPLPAVPFGDSDKADVGDWVMAVGNPFGLGGTVTAGIISARGRNIRSGPYDDFLQIDAPINKGNSGGPLFNLDGEVIGVNTAIYSPTGGSVGIGFAIPSAMVEPVIAQIRDHGQVERGWLGVQIQPVTPEIADAMGLESPAGALISEVIEGSPAKEAGLKSGDIIVGVDGKNVDGPHELARIIAQQPAGSDVELQVWRDGTEQSIRASTGSMPSREQLAGAGDQALPGGVFHSRVLAADLAALTPERRANLGVADDLTGVVVVDVEAGPALEQGLRPGDVIRKVGTTRVKAPQQVEALVRITVSTENKKAVLLLINRDGRDMFLGLKPRPA